MLVSAFGGYDLIMKAYKEAIDKKYKFFELRRLHVDYLIPSIMTHYVLILAGGQGTRLNNAKYPKQFLNIANKPMLMHSIQTFSETCPDSKIYIGIQQKDRLMWSELCENIILRSIIIYI